MAENWLQKQISSAEANVKNHCNEYRGVKTNEGYTFEQVKVPYANPRFTHNFGTGNAVQKPKS